MLVCVLLLGCEIELGERWGDGWMQGETLEKVYTCS